jgi:hypothetical protein
MEELNKTYSCALSSFKFDSSQCPCGDVSYSCQENVTEGRQLKVDGFQPPLLYRSCVNNYVEEKAEETKTIQKREDQNAN